MLVSRSSYRVSISGGSSDYSSFYTKYGSLLTGLSLDKYCYVSIKPLTITAESNFEIYYSSSEKVKNISDIKNATIRETLNYFSKQKFPLNKLSIYVANDAGFQSGLATSSALTIALLNGLYHLHDCNPSYKQLSEEAVFIERLISAGGCQDPYFCSFGGLNSLTISKEGQIDVRPLPVSHKFVEDFCQSSALFYLSSERSSYEIAASHDNVKADEFKLRILEISKKTKAAFEKEDIQAIGQLLSESWLNKRQISPLISNPYIDSVYTKAMAVGIYGLKICGTGGAGYCLAIFDKNKREEIIHKMNLPHIPIGIDYCGAKIILNEKN